MSYLSKILILGGDIRSRSLLNIGDSFGTSFHIDRSRCVGDWTFIVEQCVSKLSAKKQQRKGGLLKKQSMHFPEKDTFDYSD